MKARSHDPVALRMREWSVGWLKRLFHYLLRLVGIEDWWPIVRTLMEPSQREGWMLALRLLDSAQEQVALLFGDMDDFTGVNYAYSYQAGNDVLAETICLIKEAGGKSALFVRFPSAVSGFVHRTDSFVVLLPNMGKQQAIEVTEKMRQSVQDHVFWSTDGRQVRVTISIGVALYPCDAEDLISLHRFAYRAMCLAKRMGKNRVVLHGR